MDAFVVLAVVTLTGVLMYLPRFVPFLKNTTLRPIKSYETLTSQVGRAVESGRQLHFSLGRAGLNETANATSLSAITALDYLANKACANGVPPVVTVGEGTLLAGAQDSLRGAYASARRHRDFDPAAAQFVASQNDPTVYGAGVNVIMHQEDVATNIAMGHLGTEIGFMAEGGNQMNIEQVFGSDDPEGLAVATAFTANVLIGEEMLAAGAYLDSKPLQIASLQAQDILRLLIMLSLLLVAVKELFGAVIDFLG